jgi:hypothetical protein
VKLSEIKPFYRTPLSVSSAVAGSDGQAGLRVVPDVLALGTERQPVPRAVVDDDGLGGPTFRALELGRSALRNGHGLQL